MEKIKFVINCFFILMFLTISSAYAASFDYSCVDCHEKPALPAKHIVKENFTGCFDCHKDGGKSKKLGWFVHNKHLGGQDLNDELCTTCHRTDSEGEITINNSPVIKISKEDIPDYADRFKTWVKSDKLAYAHNEKGVGCSGCHTTFDPDETDNISSKCINCHGNFQDVAKLTDDKTKYERNPHKSHYPRLQCVKCHSVHGDFNDYCDKCHHTGFKWKLKG